MEQTATLRLGSTEPTDFWRTFKCYGWKLWIGLWDLEADRNGEFRHIAQKPIWIPEFSGSSPMNLKVGKTTLQGFLMQKVINAAIFGILSANSTIEIGPILNVFPLKNLKAF